MFCHFTLVGALVSSLSLNPAAGLQPGTGSMVTGPVLFQSDLVPEMRLPLVYSVFERADLLDALALIPEEYDSELDALIRDIQEDTPSIFTENPTDEDVGTLINKLIAQIDAAKGDRLFWSEGDRSRAGTVKLVKWLLSVAIGVVGVAFAVKFWREGKRTEGFTSLGNFWLMLGSLLGAGLLMGGTFVGAGLVLPSFLEGDGVEPILTELREALEEVR